MYVIGTVYICHAVKKQIGIYVEMIISRKNTYAHIELVILEDKMTQARFKISFMHFFV